MEILVVDFYRWVKLAKKLLEKSFVCACYLLKDLFLRVGKHSPALAQKKTHKNWIPELCLCNTVVVGEQNVFASLRAFKNDLEECFVEFKLMLQKGVGILKFISNKRRVLQFEY